MKRIISILLCVCAITAGCSRQPVEESIPQALPAPQETPAQTVPSITVSPEETIPPMEYQNPLTAASIVSTAHTVTADTGVTLYRCSSQSLSLVVNEHAVADAIMQDFSSRNGKHLSAVEAALQAASEEYTGQSDWNSYFCDTFYEVSRIDQMILSLSATETFFDGTPLSGQSMLAFSYDMQTGLFLRLGDILAPDYSADTLANSIIAALEDQKDMLYDDYADSISAMFATNAPVENWCLTGTGLRFFFNPYEIAPHSMGIILAEVPYSSLTGLLKDEYFPAETVEFTGDLSMVPLEQADITAVRQFAEVLLDNAGSQYAILPMGTVLDLRIETGTWTRNGTFLPDATVFAAEALTEGNAVLLQLLDADLGTLCITYRTGNQNISMPWQTK